MLHWRPQRATPTEANLVGQVNAQDVQSSTTMMMDRRPKRKQPVDMNLFDLLQDNDHDKLVTHHRSSSSPSKHGDVQLDKIDHNETQPSATRATYPLRQFTQPKQGFAYHVDAPFKLCKDVSRAKGDTRSRQVDSYEYTPPLRPRCSSSTDLRQEIPPKLASVPTFLVTSTKDTSCDYIFVESSTSLATKQVEVFRSSSSSQANRMKPKSALSTASMQVETDDSQYNVTMVQHRQPKRAKVAIDDWNPPKRRGESMDPVVHRDVATEYEVSNFAQARRRSNEGDGRDSLICGCHLRPPSGRRFRCASILSMTMKLGDDVESHMLQIHLVQHT